VINPLLLEIKEGMRLWTPCGEDDQFSSQEVSTNLILCGQALNDFLALRISPQDYLDIIDSCEVNIDDYLDTVNYNLHDFL
jgi:hypothetical protein